MKTKKFLDGIAFYDDDGIEVAFYSSILEKIKYNGLKGLTFNENCFIINMIRSYRKGDKNERS